MTGKQKVELFKKRIREEIIPKYPEYKKVETDGLPTTLDNAFLIIITDIGFSYQFECKTDIKKSVKKEIAKIYDEIVFGET